ncbi:MAG: GntR family transcriptional regulator, partial [Acidobacteria bacterium]|nr:GntR family transcriptional regulator [Acidobacteriota bacterium]
IGRLTPGEAVPSVREVSKDLRVNPATVQKAYQRLCDEGLLAVRRGEGTFVQGQSVKLDGEHRREELREAAVRYASLAATIGATALEARRIVQREIERVMDGDSKGAK